MPSFKLNWFLKESQGECRLQGMCENGGEQKKIRQSSLPPGLTFEGLFKKPVIVKVGSLAHCFGFEEGCNYLSRIGITCFIVFHKLFKAKDRKWF